MMTIESDKTDSQRKKEREIERSIRTCVGCGKRDSLEAVVRVVHDPSSGEIAVDIAGTDHGRGAHVHASPDCVKKALKGGFAKSFKSKVTCTPQSFGEQIVTAADRRIEGLLGGARRAKHVQIGSDAVCEALQKNEAVLVVVACDAAAAAELSEVRRAIAEGKAVAFSDKKRLGAIFNKDEVAVCAVLTQGVATAVTSAYLASRPFRSEAWWSPEVR